MCNHALISGKADQGGGAFSVDEVLIGLMLAGHESKEVLVVQAFEQAEHVDHGLFCEVRMFPRRVGAPAR